MSETPFGINSTDNQIQAQDVEVIVHGIMRLTFFTSLFFTHSIKLSSTENTERETLLDQSAGSFTCTSSKHACASELH